MIDYEKEYKKHIGYISENRELEEWLQESLKGWNELDTPIKERYEQICELYDSIYDNSSKEAYYKRKLEKTKAGLSDIRGNIIEKKVNNKFQELIDITITRIEYAKADLEFLRKISTIERKIEIIDNGSYERI